jgi:hypothetical protein
MITASLCRVMRNFAGQARPNIRSLDTVFVNPISGDLP